MTIFHFLTSVSWKGRPQLLSVDTSPAVGTSIMASEPLGETSPMVRLLAGTSHCANLARKQIDLCQLELFPNLLALFQVLKADRAGGLLASLHPPAHYPTLHLRRELSYMENDKYKYRDQPKKTEYKHKDRPKKYKYKEQPPLLFSLLLLTTPTRTSAPWSPNKKRQLIQFQFKHLFVNNIMIVIIVCTISKNVTLAFSKWWNLPNQIFLTLMYNYRS